MAESPGGNTAFLIKVSMQQLLNFLASWTISEPGRRHHDVRMLGCVMLPSNRRHIDLEEDM
jgi:hypothetical protein